MGHSKAKRDNKAGIKVAKRGEKEVKAKVAESKEPQAREPVKGEPTEAAKSQPAKPQSEAAEPEKSQPAKPRSRQASGVNPRKVSEGLKQLPPDAYRFVRESYLMLDSDGSGSVSKSTMRDMLASLGLRDHNDERLNSMLERTGEPVTFAAYLAVMGELLSDLPSREEMDLMLEAFQSKDGSFDQTELKQALLRDGMSSDEIDAVLHRFSKPTRYGEVFDPKAFANAMSI